MLPKPEGICVLEGCSNPLGPDALEIVHKGITTSGICEICLASVEAVRLLLVKTGNSRLLHIDEMVTIDKLTS